MYAEHTADAGGARAARPRNPLRKLGFLTIGLFDEADPAPGPRDHAGDHRARRAARLRQRLGAPPAPAVRHLLAGRRPGRRLAAHQPHRAGHRRHPARLGEPAAAGRGPRHRRHPVRRPAQPRRQRRPADALRRRQGRALPRHRRRRGLQLRAGRAAARLRARRAGHHLQRHRGLRGVLRPRPAALARPAAAACGTAAAACGRRSGPASTA